MNTQCRNPRRSHIDYAQSVVAAVIPMPDGIRIELAARMTGHKLPANLIGTDMVPALLARAT